MKTVVLLIACGLWWANQVVAQQVPRIPQDTKRLRFQTKKVWEAARWYVIGYWKNFDEIEWLDGNKTRLSYDSESCKGGVLKIVRTNILSPAQKKLDIITNDRWVALEVDPTIERETFEVSDATEEGRCVAELNLAYKWKPESTGPRPMLMIVPERNKYYGYEIDFDSRKLGSRADIQLDVIAGDWYALLNNSKAPARKNLHLFPSIVLRAEGRFPGSRSWGYLGSLEQSVFVLGGVEKQNVVFSDWQFGTYYQIIQPWFDGTQMRVFAAYKKALKDDGRIVQSLSSMNSEAIYLLGGALMNVYFARRYMMGGEFSYGFPNSFAGRGMLQSYIEALGRVGVRVNDMLIVLGESGYRSYRSNKAEPESLIILQGGIRLEL